MYYVVTINCFNQLPLRLQSRVIVKRYEISGKQTAPGLKRCELSNYHGTIVS